MRLRVVCGFEVTMAIFCPTSRFTSVLLPAFGRPTIATNPARCPALVLFSVSLITCLLVSATRTRCESIPVRQVLPAPFPVSVLSVTRWQILLSRELKTSPGVHRRARQLLTLHAQHFPLIGFKHLKSKSLQVAFLSRSWNFPAHVTQQSRNRRYRFIRRFSEVHAQHLFHICDRRATTHHQRSGSFPHHFQFRMRAVCSAYAHDFFHQVFHRSDSRDASMFINNYSHGLIFLSHLPQQFRTNFCFRHEQHWLHQFPHVPLQQIRIRNLQ